MHKALKTPFLALKIDCIDVFEERKKSTKQFGHLVKDKAKEKEQQWRSLGNFVAAIFMFFVC